MSSSMRKGDIQELFLIWNIEVRFQWKMLSQFLLISSPLGEFGVSGLLSTKIFFFRWGGDLDVGKFQFCLSKHNKTLLSFWVKMSPAENHIFGFFCTSKPGAWLRVKQDKSMFILFFPHANRGRKKLMYLQNFPVTYCTGNTVLSFLG